MERSSSHTRDGLRSSSVWLMAALPAVLVVYAFFATAGTFAGYPTYMEFYDLQAEAFRAGQLHLPVAPAPELLAQADPYDPAHRHLWLWDATLHEGRYYLYWGPLPALLQALAKSALGVDRLVGDQYLVLGFGALQTVFGALIGERVARRLFPASPRVLRVAALLAFAFANPLLHLVTSPGTYQAAILGAQAFLLGGVLLAIDVAWRGRLDRGGVVALTGAGSCWALSLACRVSLLPTVVVLSAATLFFLRPLAHEAKAARTRGIAGLLGPLALVVVALLAYNHARFGSPFDTGIEKQLTTPRFGFALAFVAPNLYSYLLRPFDPSCVFPFAHQVIGMGARALPSWLALPEGWQAREPLVGLLVGVPWLWLIALAVPCVVRRPPRPPSPERRQRARARRFCALAFAVTGTLPALPALGIYMATMRYLGDVTPGLTLLATLSAHAAYACSRTHRALRAAVVGAVCATCAATVALGCLLGYQGYDQHFMRFSPHHQRIVEALSVCR